MSERKHKPKRKAKAGPPVMPEETKETSHYEFGRQWECWVAKYFMARLGGSYDLAPGSRGPADVTNFTPKVIILTQVKASRAGSDAHPSAGYREQSRLQENAQRLAKLHKMPAVAMLALIKGHEVKFRRLGIFGTN